MSTVRRVVRNPWLRFLLSRLLGMAAVLFGLLLLTFTMVRLVPGDPARAVAGAHADARTLDVIRRELGIDRPFIPQLADYLVRVAHLDLGRSFVTGEDVTQVISERLPKTVELAGVSLLLVMTISVAVGLAMAAYTRDGRHRTAEVIFGAVTGVASSLPTYLGGTLLTFVFAVQLQWLPVAGSDNIQSVILPALSVSILPLAALVRIVRLETLNVLAQDYIQTARSKLLSPVRIYARHVLPNVLAGTLTIGGVYFVALIGGEVVVENVFAWPGLGTALVAAVLAHDYTVIQGVTLLLGLLIVTVNTLVDITLSLLDPRSVIRST